MIFFLEKFPEVLFAAPSGIYRIEINGENLKLFRSDPTLSLDFHKENEWIFWIDLTDHALYRSDLYNNSMFVTKIAKGVSNGWEPIVIAVDDKHNQIYVIDSLGKKIDTLDLNGNKIKSGIIKSLVAPNDIVLDPAENVIFYGDNEKVQIQLFALLIN